MAIFLNSDSSQGSVVTQLRCGGIINKRFCCKFTSESVSERILKSVSIWQSYGQYYSGLFFIDSQCTIHFSLELLCFASHAI